MSKLLTPTMQTILDTAEDAGLNTLPLRTLFESDFESAFNVEFADALAWEADVYGTDPLGGDPASF